MLLLPIPEHSLLELTSQVISPKLQAWNFVPKVMVVALGRALQREFYNRDPAAVAKELLGKVLVRETPEGVTAGIWEWQGD